MSKRTTRNAGALALASMLGGVSLAACAPPTTGSTLSRPDDPVVLTGSQLSALNGVAPGRIAAFATSNGAWVQIPVQVDERLDTRMTQVYGLPASTRFFNASIDIPVNDVYADPNTFVGADPNPAFDGDDELVFMSRDAGGPAGSLARPAGTLAGGVEVRVGDPTATGTSGYVYLFPTDGSLDPGAGFRYVDYQFKLTSGDYKTTYKRTDGPNPETSTIKGMTYEASFSDRWTMDRFVLTQGSKPTTDIIDRVKWDAFRGLCVRHENTFNDDEGAFIVNKSGPVRALRSWVGANSGPNTQNTQIFYDQSYEFQVDLRVHSIPDTSMHIDFNREAIGMVMRNSLVPNGVTVDGQPDTVPSGAPGWVTLTGPQGSLAVSQRTATNATAAATFYYEDDTTPSNPQCTGDSEAIGDMGAAFRANIACTDPGSSGCDPNTYLRGGARIVAKPPSVDAAAARSIAERGARPLTATVTNRN